MKHITIFDHNDKDNVTFVIESKEHGLQYPIIPADMLEQVIVHTWHVTKDRDTFYVHRNITTSEGKQAKVALHRQILGIEPLMVDHINGKALNNRWDNIRAADARLNGENRKKQAGTSSKYKGVSWSKRPQKWRVQICSGPIQPNGKRKQKTLGYYDNEVEAALAYDCAARKDFTFPCTNLDQGLLEYVPLY